MKIIYLDTETTGLKPGQIAQLSYLVELNGQLIKAYNHYYEVESMDEGATKVTGLTVEKCREYSRGIKFGDVVDTLLKDFEDAIIVGHNISFDIRFLKEEFLRLGIYFEPYKQFDTMSSLKGIMKIPSKSSHSSFKSSGRGFYKAPKLSEATEYANITNQNILEYMQLIYGDIASAHDSRYDAVAVWLLCYTLRTRGILAI